MEILPKKLVKKKEKVAAVFQNSNIVVQIGFIAPINPHKWL